jgi:hypothetical protein
MMLIVREREPIRGKLPAAARMVARMLLSARRNLSPPSGGAPASVVVSIGMRAWQAEWQRKGETVFPGPASFPK